MNLADRIARSIDLSGFSQTELASKLNVTQDILSNWVRGVVKNPKIEILIKLAEICKVDLGWLISGKGNIERTEPIKMGTEDLTLVPILGNIPAGLPVYAAEEVREGHVPYLKKDISNDAFALKIYGDSMSPELEEGEIVICEPKIFDLLPGKGEIVAVRIHTDTTIKRLLKCKNQVMLTPINIKYPPILIKPENIQIIAKVVGKIKKYK